MSPPKPFVFVVFVVLFFSIITIFTASPTTAAAESVISSASRNSTIKLSGGGSNGPWTSIVLPVFENPISGSSIRVRFSIDNATLIDDVPPAGSTFEISAQAELQQLMGNGVTSILYEMGTSVDGVVGGQPVQTFLEGPVGPCDASVLAQPSQNLQTQFLFRSNATMYLHVSVSYVLYNTSVRANESVTIPTERWPDFYTYVPTSSHYDLTLHFESTEPDVTLADRLDALFIGCHGDPAVDFSQLNVTEWTQTWSGLSGPTFMELDAIYFETGKMDIKWTFVESANTAKNDDDKLRTWQIILIAVAGAVTVGIVALIFVGIGFIIWRSKRGYQTLN